MLWLSQYQPSQYTVNGVNKLLFVDVFLIAALLRIQVFQDATLCRWVSGNRRFGVTDGSVLRDR